MAILVLGATSEIAQKNIDLFAARGEHLILAARHLAGIQYLKWPLGSSVQFIYYSARETFQSILSAEMFWLQCVEMARVYWNEGISGVYVAQGFLPSGDPKQWGDEVGQTIFLNFTSITFFLEAAARWYETHAGAVPAPWIAVISSVAGERGRWSNYPYGAAKAGLTAYLSGLRARLYPIGVHVLTVKPGLVRTRMIAHRPQARSAAAVSPTRIAFWIDRAIARRQNVLYAPPWWRWAMLLLRAIPEFIFKRLKF